MAVTSPWIGGLEPSDFQIGQPGQTIRLTGRNLTGGQVFIDNAAPQPTTVVSPTELTFNVDPSLVTHNRSALIRVRAANGHISNPAWIVFHFWPLNDRPGTTTRRATRGNSFDPGEHTVAEVVAYVDRHPGEAERVLGLEQAGKSRKTLVDQLRETVA
jgi:hypothetical protein